MLRPCRWEGGVGEEGGKEEGGMFEQFIVFQGVQERVMGNTMQLTCVPLFGVKLLLLLA